MANHPNRSRLPPLAAGLKAFRQREGQRRGLPRKISARALAEEIGIPLTTYVEMESRTPPTTHMARVLTFFVERTP